MTRALAHREVKIKIDANNLKPKIYIGVLFIKQINMRLETLNGPFYGLYGLQVPLFYDCMMRLISFNIIQF